RLRLCRRWRAGFARRARGALARGAVHPRARPDRRPAGLRENAVAARRHVRPAHRLELPGAGVEALQAFPGVASARYRAAGPAGPIMWRTSAASLTITAPFPRHSDHAEPH